MHPFAHHRQWNAVQEVYQKLKAAGYQALLAGGCVRDLIMNRKPNDFDIASDAIPDQVGELFPSALLVGREFGVTIIPYEGFQIEVATFRVDGSYKDGRRPETVTFSTPEEDAKRRDFTVNALFYDLGQKQVIDFVNGQADISAKLIRAVGDPERRFTEDKLRLLRAVRFAAQLNFEIEPATFASIKKLASQVLQVSQERIRDELTKLFKATHASRGLELLIETGLMAALLPELGPKFNDKSLLARTLKRLERKTESQESAWLNFLYEPILAHGEKAEATLKTLTKRLKFSNQDADAIFWTFKNRDQFLGPQPKETSPKLIRTLAHPYSSVAEEFFKADVTDTAKNIWNKIHSTTLSNARKLPDRFLNGDDLIALGISKGPSTLR